MCGSFAPDAYTPSAGAPEVSSGGTVTAANWQKMQLQGCVFLPCAGCYNPNSAFKIGQNGYYWTDDQKPSNNYAYDILLLTTSSVPDVEYSENKTFKQSVS